MPAKPNSRHLALAALRKWRAGQQFADAILVQLLGSSELPPVDRAFATELFYGVVRNLTLLDFWIDRLRSGQLDPELRDLLRLGFYQLFLLETPAHAAVFETVALAPVRSRSLVNAVLRNATRTQDELRRDAKAQALSVRRSHPQFLIDRWTANLGEKNTEALCEWNNRPAPVYARINRIRISQEALLADQRPSNKSTSEDGLPGNFVRLGHVPHDALAAGHCYIQDPSTAEACLLLDPQPGDRVLDACAAPGGKAAYLAELMNNTGFLLACDRDQNRVGTLRDNLERLGVTIAQTKQHDWTTDDGLTNQTPFDRILVDAPCSNTGVMRRRVDLRWRLRPEDFSRMPVEQLAILRATIPLLKSGGVLVYSTCSIEPEENQEVVRAIRHEFPSLELTQQISLLPFRNGFDGAFAARFRKG